MKWLYQGIRNKMKPIKEYRTFTDEQLEKELKKLNIKYMESYGAKQKTKAENRTQVRKLIARVKTIQKEREREE